MIKSKLFTLIAVLGILSLLAVACNGELSFPSPSPAPGPGPAPAPPAGEDANFRFLISDEVNAIDKFTSVNITISKIGIHSKGESANWTEFTPDITEVDLKPLVGENALEIWNGHITPGEYTKVFIYVDSVVGTLTGEYGGGQPEIKLPSNKLQISKPFVVSETEPTTFVYDVTIIEAGKSGRYNLKPQIAQSGADQPFKEVKQERDRDRDGDDDEVALEGIRWTLQSFGNPADPTEVLDDTEITITFNSADGTINGSGGCNTYFGAYEVDGDALTIIPPIASTEMACDLPIMDQEQLYYTILQAAESFEIDDDALTIVCGDDVLNFEEEEEEEEEEVTLEDTLWELKSYGDPADPTELVDDTEITITFNSADGTINGSGGCNSYSGGYEVDGTILTIIPPIASTAMACDLPIMDQEQLYFTILQAAESFEIDGDKLTITAGENVLFFETE